MLVGLGFNYVWRCCWWFGRICCLYLAVWLLIVLELQFFWFGGCGACLFLIELLVFPIGLVVWLGWVLCLGDLWVVMIVLIVVD